MALISICDKRRGSAFPRKGANVTDNGRNGKKRPHDDAGYRARRRLLMASVTPATRCARCGRLAHEHPLHANGKVGRWDCGHQLDGRNDAPLALEWSTCNRSAGGRLGNARRWGRAGGTPHPRPVGPHYPGHYNLSDSRSVGAPPCVQRDGELCPTCAAWRAKNPNPRG